MFCRNCGTKLNENDNFCSSCGYSIANYNYENQSQNGLSYNQPYVSPPQYQQPATPLYDFENITAGLQFGIYKQACGKLYIDKSQLRYKYYICYCNGSIFSLADMLAKEVTKAYNNELIIDFDDIEYTERKAPMGIGNSIEIKTKAGEKYTFNFGAGKADICNSIYNHINCYI